MVHAANHVKNNKGSGLEKIKEKFMGKKLLDGVLLRYITPQRTNYKWLL